MWLKACPRCQGDFFVEQLPAGDEITCLQCGYNPPAAVVTRLLATIRQGKRVSPIAPSVLAVAERIA